MTTLEILKGARELLSDPARWTQGHAARTAAGRKTSYQDPDAVCYCPWGALRLVGGLGADLVVLSLGFEGTSEFFAWNDAPERTHTEVLARFDKAVARLEVLRGRKRLRVVAAIVLAAGVIAALVLK